MLRQFKTVTQTHAEMIMEMQQESKRLTEHILQYKCPLTLGNANAECEQEEVSAFILSSEG